MDVVYLGLARGYAVSPDDAFAATGIPSQDGWLWTADPSIADAVRKLVRIQNKSLPPALVTLPMDGHIPAEVQP